MTNCMYFWKEGPVWCRALGPACWEEAGIYKNGLGQSPGDRKHGGEGRTEVVILCSLAAEGERWVLKIREGSGGRKRKGEGREEGGKAERGRGEEGKRGGVKIWEGGRGGAGREPRATTETKV